MKKIILIGMIVLMIALAGAQYSSIPSANITLMNQDPDPVGPGEYFEVRFRIFNDRPGTVLEDLELKLEPEYPFSLDPNEVAERVVGDLAALGSTNSLVIKYKIRVDDDVVEGTNPLKLSYRHGNTGWITKEFDINVQTLDANLAIVSVVTDPEKIKPGEEADIEIKVKNMADSALKDVSLKLDLTYSQFLSQVTAITATDSLNAFNALPFAPIGSATEQKVDMIKPGEVQTYTFKIIAFSDAESAIYKVPIQLRYYDELETLYTKNDIIGLIVGTQPDISVVIDETELAVGNKYGSVSIKIINKGFSDVKFLDVFLMESEAYEIISAPEVYIGNVDSDDYETAEFSLYLKNGATMAEKSIDLPLKVEYRDANNNLYQEEPVLSLRIREPAKMGQAQSSPVGLFVVVLIVAVVAFIFWRRRKKKR